MILMGLAVVPLLAVRLVVVGEGALLAIIFFTFVLTILSDRRRHGLFHLITLSIVAEVIITLPIINIIIATRIIVVVAHC